jgi:hypothetical protein
MGQSLISQYFNKTPKKTLVAKQRKITTFFKPKEKKPQPRSQRIIKTWASQTATATPKIENFFPKAPARIYRTNRQRIKHKGRESAFKQSMKLIRTREKNQGLTQYCIHKYTQPKSKMNYYYHIVYDTNSENKTSYLDVFESITQEKVGQMRIRDQEENQVSTYTPILDNIEVQDQHQQRGIGKALIKAGNSLTKHKLIIFANNNPKFADYITNDCEALLRSCVRDHIIKDEQIFAEDYSQIARLTEGLGV